MTPRRPTHKLAAYGWFVGVGLVLALAAGRPEIVILVCPFALALLVGLAIATTAAPSAGVELSALRVVEQDTVSILIEVYPWEPISRVDLAVNLPRGVRTRDGSVPARFILNRSTAGQVKPIGLQLDVYCAQWGSYQLGPVVVRKSDPARLFTVENRISVPGPLRVHPRPETLRSLLKPRRTRALVGNRRSTGSGEGIEFADVRPLGPGEPARHVNWPVSSRRQGLWITQRHPERNADVVVLVDSFTEVTYNQAVRAAVSLVAAYSAQRDRVGVITFGGMVRWVEPGVGIRHLYRLIDVLLASAPPTSYAWRDLRFLPARTLPPGAMVMAISPLDDERSRAALWELARRGVDLVVIEVPLEEIIRPGDDKRYHTAHRLWSLQRWARRRELTHLGASVVVWSCGRDLHSVIEELSSSRRR